MVAGGRRLNSAHPAWWHLDDLRPWMTLTPRAWMTLTPRAWMRSAGGDVDGGGGAVGGGGGGWWRASKKLKCFFLLPLKTSSDIIIRDNGLLQERRVPQRD
jgi:hypothetical protein